MSMAIPASLVGVVATAMGGTTKFLFDGHTDVQMAVRAGCVTAIAAMVGARVGGYLPDRTLETGFAVLLFIIVWRLAVQRDPGQDGGQAASPARAAGLFVGCRPAFRIAWCRGRRTQCTCSQTGVEKGHAGCSGYQHHDHRLHR